MFFELDSQSKSRKKEDLFRNYAIMKISVNLNISAADDPSDSQSVFTILVIVQIHRLNVCSTSKYVKGSSSVLCQALCWDLKKMMATLLTLIMMAR